MGPVSPVPCASAPNEQDYYDTHLAEEPNIKGMCLVEYAKTGRSSCKSCRGPIKEGTMRVGRKTKSRFHDGFETSWVHFRCAKSGISTITQLRGWRSLRFADSQKIRKETGETLSKSDAQVIERESKARWKLATKLKRLGKKPLTAMLEANEMKLSKWNLHTAAAMCADGMLFGRGPQCDVCGGADTLQIRSGIGICYGSVGGFTKCPNRVDARNIQRFRWNIPPQVLKIKWFASHIAEMESVPAGGDTSMEIDDNNVDESDQSDDDESEDNPSSGPKEDAATVPDFSTLKYIELRRECKSRGIKTTGKKHVLLNRLHGHELQASAATAAVPILPLRQKKQKKSKKKSKKTKGAKRKAQVAISSPPPPTKRGSAVFAEAKTVPEGTLQLLPHLFDKSTHTAQHNTASKAASSASASGGDAKVAALKRVPRDPAPVPPDFGSSILSKDEKAPSGEILVDADGTTVYNTALTQVDLEAGHNRSYVLQIVKGSKTRYNLFRRWGRTGAKDTSYMRSYGGQRTDTKNEVFRTAATAIAAFKKQFYKMTQFDWDDAQRFEFVKQPTGYNMVDLTRVVHEDSATGSGTRGKKKKKSSAKAQRKRVECSLEPRLRSLIEQLWDANTLIDVMKDQDVDLEQMPLGKLSKRAIERGHNILDKVRAIMDANKTETALGTANPTVLKAKLTAACTEFFSVIPSPTPRLMTTHAELQKRVDMLNVLSDLALQQSLAKKAKGLKHPLDEKYDTMNCELRALDRSDPKFEHILTYLNNTATHKSRMAGCYGYGPGNKPPELLDVFEVDRKGESSRFQQHDALDNRKLLWHGTNIGVVVAICATGLRIMPHSGGRVGRGLYFASENGKSAAYVSPARDHTGIMFLCEVALGKDHHITNDDSSLRRAPKGYDSVVAQGVYEPDAKGDVVFNIQGKDVVAPTGVPQRRPKYESSNFTNSEYLIYSESQVRLRYLLKLRMPKHQY